MTTVSVAEELGRRAIGLDLKWEYLKLGAARMRGTLRGLAL
jgi:DNA modification methylase